MKLVAILMSFGFVTQIMAADKPTGCLVQIKNRIITDPACKCLEKNACVMPKTFTYSKNFFDAKDINNKAVFSEKEKNAYQESYKILNKILVLKASGKGMSAEITKYYVQLEKVNAELEELIKENHPEQTNAMNARQAEQSTKRKIRNEKRDKMINDFLDNPGNKPLARESSPSPISSPAANIVPTQKAEPAALIPTPVAATQKTEGLSNYDKGIILKNLNNNNYEVKKDDSLFDIISKTYKSKAYKRLLVPSESQE